MRPTSRIYSRRFTFPVAAERGSRVAPRCGAFRNESAQEGPVSGDDHVDPVDDGRKPADAKKTAEGSCDPDLAEHKNTSARVPPHRRAITQHDPPAFPAPFLGHAREQPAGLLLRERKKGQLSTLIDPGDDPRRPSAELSLSRIEQDRPLELRVRHDVSPRQAIR